MSEIHFTWVIVIRRANFNYYFQLVNICSVSIFSFETRILGLSFFFFYLVGFSVLLFRPQFALL